MTKLHRYLEPISVAVVLIGLRLAEIVLISYAFYVVFWK